MLAEELAQRLRLEYFVHPLCEVVKTASDVIEVDVTRSPLAPKEEPHVRAALNNEVRDGKSGRGHFNKDKVKPLDNLPCFAF
jgi:hypothetical protein